MSLKNKSKYAILGILSLSPSSGYDIKKYSDRVLSNFWNENFGHIYPTLNTMLQEGLIEILSKERNEKKITYGITPKGMKEFNEWLVEETVPQPPRSEFLLKLIFSSMLPKENVVSMLEKYKMIYEKKLDECKKMQKSLVIENNEISKERNCYLTMILRRGILSNEAVIRWCDETIEMLTEIQ